MLTVSSTNAAGTIIHTWRGASRELTNSSIDELPTIPSPVIVATASGDTSNPTQSWPARINRRTMLAPIRPSPIIPSCMR